MINIIIEAIPWVLIALAVLFAIGLIMVFPSLLIPVGIVAFWLFIRSAIKSARDD